MALARSCARRALSILCTIAGTVAPLGSAARAQSVAELREMSLTELTEINVSSVSKTVEALSGAPAAIYVIDHETIVRSGANTVPEILRLAPNLQVAQTGASHYTITARGLSGNQNAQNFTNKLLVLIDGRSVYTPLFSGVYWDMQDVVAADIDRIEVISGPGATLWGANAVNGVINIITRRASGTQGALVTAQAGNRERTGSLRYGGRIGQNLAFRVYASGLDSDQTRTSAHAPANDSWWRAQGGFRLDWSPAGTDAVTVQGDLFRGSENQLGAGDEKIRGQNLLARWTRTAEDGGALQVQAYYDRNGRETLGGGGRFDVDTYDLDVQHSFTPATGHALVVGGGLRASRYHIFGSASLLFDPPRRTLLLANLFAQDSIDLAPRTRLVLGLKLEDDPYVGISVLPNARLSWKPVDPVLLWAAASRAIRSPTPFDRDVIEKAGGVTLLTGDDDFRTEKLTAFEAGTRIQAGSRASLSLSAFYNRYDDLRSIEATPVTLFPLRWDNGLRSHSHGLEAWADYAPTTWWRLSGGINLLREHFRFKPGASGFAGTAQLGSDPRVQAMLRSSLDLGPDVTIDADLRHVGRRRDPDLGGYTELGGRIGWRVAGQIQLFVSGLNLLHAWHQELPAPANEIPRRIMAGVQWRL